MSGDLPRPGAVGIAIRLALAALVGYLGYGAVVDAPSFWDGFDDVTASLLYLGSVTAFSSWVVNELLHRDWGQRPTALLLLGLGAMVMLGWSEGRPFGPLYGTYLWVWVVAFSALLGPAHLFAAILRTPGCEMRSYLHLWRRLRGRDIEGVACPGWIDRFDGVRLGGAR